MSKNVFKFGSSDMIKFIEIYRNHECLWDTENIHYKNREARDAALKSLSIEFGFENFGPKEIINKIKNIRTQYHAEKKKVKNSMGTGSGSNDVYKPKLAWYNLIDSFLRKTSEARETTSNLSNHNDQQLLKMPEDTGITDHCNTENSDAIDIAENVETIQDVDTSSVSSTFKTPNKKSGFVGTHFIQSALDKLESIEKRAKLEKEEDDLDSFGKYVTSTLRKLSTKNCIHAQDAIQNVLSKYRLQNEEDNERRNSTPMPQSPYLTPNSEDQCWNTYY